MRTKEATRGLLIMDREKIRETRNLSPREKLEWLEEANEFVRKAVSKEKLLAWERLKKRS